MLAFLLLASRNRSPLGPSSYAAAQANAARYLPFEPETNLVWENRSGTVAVFGWQALTANAGLGSHWHVDPHGGLTAFSGHCWPRISGWTHGTGMSWGEQLAAWLDSHPTADAHEELFGIYSLLQLDPDGAGMAATDLLGAGELFTGEHDDWVAISNRSGLAAAAATGFAEEPERDPLAMGWLAFWDSSIGDDSGYWDATRLPFNNQITIDADAGVRIAPRPSPFWHRRGPSPTSATYDELIDELEADLRATIRVIGKLPEANIELRLSGGKDSRLLTALLYDEGLHDRVQFMTHGLPGHADARSAELVAQRLGLRWKLDDRSEVSVEEEERRLLRHTFLAQGATSGWDSCGIPVPTRGISLSGIGGEFTNWGPTASLGLSAITVPEVVQHFAAKPEFDPAQVLTPEARRHFHRVVRDWVEREASLGQEPARIPSLFTTQQRTRCRSGPSRAVKPSLWLGPFLNPSYIRFRQLLPIEDRVNQRVHLDLLRRCGGELWTIPLANETWPEGAVAIWPDADRLRAIEPMRSLPGAPQGWRTARFPELKPMLQAYLDDPANPIYEIVDYTALHHILRRRKVTGQQLRILYGVATGAIWLAHRETPVAVNRNWGV